MTTLKIVKYQLQDMVRSRWVIAYTLFFLLVTDALFRFGGDGDQVVVSLMNVVLVVVPLIAVVLGAMFLYGSREYIELLLAQPVGRRSIYRGLFAGLTLPLAAGFVLGVGIPFAVHGAAAGAGAGLAILLVAGVLVTVIFVALAFAIALATEDRIKGLALAIVAWLFFAVVYNGLVLLVIQLFSAYPLQRAVIALSLLNPIDLGRILLLLEFEISALMGFTGAVFQRFFGSGLGQGITLAALVTWVAVPFLLGQRAFARKNF